MRRFRRFLRWRVRGLARHIIAPLFFNVAQYLDTLPYAIARSATMYVYLFVLYLRPGWPDIHNKLKYRAFTRNKQTAIAARACQSTLDRGVSHRALLMANARYQTQLGNISKAIESHKRLMQPHLDDGGPFLIESVLSPSFIVIGAAKSGTTSLYSYFCQHPRMRSPFKKEPSYFGMNFECGPTWYHSQFPAKEGNRLAFSGEASANYLSYPEAAQRIRAHFPEIKLICLLRNPIDRAYSRYQHLKRMGRSHQTFESVIEPQLDALVQSTKQDVLESPVWDHHHVKHGLYVYYLENWIELFGEDLLIIPSSRFFSETQTVMLDIFTFLNIEPHQMQAYETFNKSGHHSPLSAELRERMATFYRPHNERLETLLGYKLGWD